MKITTLLWLLAASVAAQAAPISWAGGVCEYHAQYNPQQISLAKLKNAVALIDGDGRLDPVGLADAVNGHRQAIEVLRQLDLPNDAAILQLRERIIARQNFWMQLEAIKQKAQSARNPEILLQFKPAANRCEREFAAVKANGFNSKSFTHDWHNCANDAQPDVPDALFTRARKALHAHLTHVKKACED